MKNKHIQKRLLIALCTCMILITFITATVYSKKQNCKQKEIIATTTKEVETVISLDYLFDYDYKQDTLEDIILTYLHDNSISEDTISIAYYNFLSEETLYYNQTTLMFAASTYKLPLCMYFYELIAANDYSLTSLLTYYPFCNEDSMGYIYQNYDYLSQISLNTLLYQSIVNSDNVASWILFTELGGWEQMMNNISAYSSEYYTYTQENYFSTGYMLDVLIYLYQHQETFSTLLNDMDSFQSECYLSTYMEDVQIANKYGNYDSYYNDIGIIFSESPYAIAVYCNLAENGPQVIAEINRIIYEYNDANNINLHPVSAK